MLKADKEAFLPLPTPLSSLAVLGSVCFCVCVRKRAAGKGKWEDEEGDAGLRPGLCSLSYSCRHRC